MHRFYLEAIPTQIEVGGIYEIQDIDVVHQMFRVLRLHSGEKVTLFNQISVGIFQINTIDKKQVICELLQKSIAVKPEKEIVLIMSLVKKDTIEWIVEKATELGVTRIVLAVSARSEKKDVNMVRLVTKMREATEQSGWTQVPIVEEPEDFTVVIENITKSPAQFLVCLPSAAQKLTEYIFKKYNYNKDSKDNKDNNKIVIAIGPEGGYTPEEESLIQKNGFVAVSLGKSTLRAETAAIAALSILA